MESHPICATKLHLVGEMLNVLQADDMPNAKNGQYIGVGVGVLLSLS